MCVQVQYGIFPDDFTFNLLIDSYIKDGNFKSKCFWKDVSNINIQQTITQQMHVFLQLKKLSCFIWKHAKVSTTRLYPFEFCSLFCFFYCPAACSVVEEVMLQEAFDLPSTQILSLYAMGNYLATRPQLSVSEPTVKKRKSALWLFILQK